MRHALVLCLALIAPLAWAGGDQETPVAQPHLLDRFKALAGDWAADGLDGNSDPKARLRYEVSAGGNAVVETIFPGSPHEMRTVYFRDGDDVVLTHYCASGNHPRMRASAEADGRVVFAFDGASNFDPATAGHMHDAAFEFVGPDELKTRWNFWKDGKASGTVADVHVRRVVVDAAATATDGAP